MVVDAVVLAGGRSSRLGGVAKRSLVVDGKTLLAHALAAAAPARNRVIVGDPDEVSGVPSAREEPPFSGPAAAVAAGLDLLAALAPGARADFVLVLSCDMPRSTGAVNAILHASTTADGADGLIAVDDQGRRQPLAALYRESALDAAVSRLPRCAPDGLSGASMARLIGGMRLVEVRVSTGSTDDIDTWQDAAQFGIEKG